MECSAIGHASLALDAGEFAADIRAIRNERSETAADNKAIPINTREIAADSPETGIYIREIAVNRAEIAIYTQEMTANTQEMAFNHLETAKNMATIVHDKAEMDGRDLRIPANTLFRAISIRFAHRGVRPAQPVR